MAESGGAIMSERGGTIAGSAARRPYVTVAVGVLNKLLEATAVILMLSLTALVLSNALGRYFFNHPLPWTEEVVLVMLAWQMAVGIVLAGMRQSLITCDVLLERLPHRTKRAMATAVALLGAAAMGYFAVLTWQYLMLFGGDLTPILKIPKGAMIVALFCGGVGLSFSLLASAFARKES